jgi:hypothetical protein
MMKKQGVTSVWLLSAACGLAGCAAVAPEPAPATPPTLAAPAEPRAPAPAAHSGGQRYRCEQDLSISVQLAADSATVDAGPRGKEVLGRDAGGLTPRHTVYSGTRLRAEFGVGADGREALLHWLAPQPQTVRCTLA